MRAQSKLPIRSQTQLANRHGRLLTVACGLLWLFPLTKFYLSLDTQPVRLILHSESCTYLQIRHVPTQPYAIPNTCSADLPFQTDFFEHGGSFNFSNSAIRLMNSQIIAIEPLPRQGWTADQVRMGLILVIGSIFIVAACTWLFIVV